MLLHSNGQVDGALIVPLVAEIDTIVAIIAIKLLSLPE